MTDMVEVMSIQVFNNQSKDGSIRGDELYGAIMGNGRCGNTSYFKQEGGLSDLSLLEDNSLSLTGPFRCNVGGCWRLRLKLYLKKGDNFLELCDGFLRITPNDHYFSDKSMTGMVQGKDGYALINLATFTYAVQATIEVSVDAGAGRAFYGHIRSTNDMRDCKNEYQKKYFQTTLFCATKDNPSWTEGNNIPLSRRVTAVPLLGSLIIRAELFDSSHSPVADGDAYFEAQTCGDETLKMGCFHVKVTWAKHKSHRHSDACNLGAEVPV